MGKIIFMVVGGIVGIVVGGYLFADTQPRSFLSLHQCEEGGCLGTSELVGLLGSVGVQKLPAAFEPVAVIETDKTVVIDHPFPLAQLHYVIIPKKDIKSPSDITETDDEYLVDAYAAMARLIRDKNLEHYKIIINGPGFQTVNYLHFNLVADLE